MCIVSLNDVKSRHYNQKSISDIHFSNQCLMTWVTMNVPFIFHRAGLTIALLFSMRHVEQAILFRIRMEEKTPPMDQLIDVFSRMTLMCETVHTLREDSIVTTLKLLMLHHIASLCVRHLILWLIMPGIFG
jgi:hypothetical protein